jgi:phosphatidylglycerol:prolipoprotein diacylglycerol transferase
VLAHARVTPRRCAEFDVTLATLNINVDPALDLGPISLPWHGLMTVVGIFVAGAVAWRYATERELGRERVFDLVLVTAIAGMVGARLLYLIEHDPAALLDPGDWLGSEGFSFYGAVILGPLAAYIYMRWAGIGLAYLDALASGFGLGLAVGRVGDILIGEHFGPPSQLPWAISYSHPEAHVPSPDVAYHPGALYEAFLGLAVFAVLWPLRDRLRAPGLMFVSVVGLYAAGRFAIFFVRSDSDELAWGLSNSQWLSLAIVAGAVALVWWLRRRAPELAPPAGAQTS